VPGWPAGRPSGSADPTAGDGVGVGREQDDAEIGVEGTEDKDLREEAPDLAGLEVDHPDHEPPDQGGRRIVDDLGRRAAGAELRPEVDRQLPGGLAGLGKLVDREDPADPHVDLREVVEADHAGDDRAPAWLAWLALGTVYVVWGSTYLAIRLMVETVPALLGAGVRFLVAGALLFAWLAWRARRDGTRTDPRGPVRRFDRREAAGAAVVGILLTAGGNGLVTVAERDIDSSLAALVVASVPLVIVLIRALTGERVGRAALLGVGVGFAGVAILLVPGAGARGTGLLGVLLVLAASVSWGAGSVTSTRVALPADPLASTAVQMTAGGVVMVLAGLATGEASGVDLAGMSLRSGLAFGYLVVFGSLAAFTAYAWLLQRAAISRVSTYAYVNPVIAVALGWGLLGERIAPTTLAGAAIIVTSVAFIVRSTRPARPTRPAAATGDAAVATTARPV
jgi:drug/metabolite transporter (DMT)-like permease